MYITAKIYKGKYEAELEIPGGWGVQMKKPSIGEVWIFSGAIHCRFYQSSQHKERRNILYHRKVKCLEKASI